MPPLRTDTARFRQPLAVHSIRHPAGAPCTLDTTSKTLMVLHHCHPRQHCPGRAAGPVCGLVPFADRLAAGGTRLQYGQLLVTGGAMAAAVPASSCWALPLDGWRTAGQSGSASLAARPARRQDDQYRSWSGGVGAGQQRQRAIFPPVLLQRTATPQRPAMTQYRYRYGEMTASRTPPDITRLPAGGAPHCLAAPVFRDAAHAAWQPWPSVCPAFGTGSAALSAEPKCRQRQ
jgi:hypothetical protein